MQRITAILLVGGLVLSFNGCERNEVSPGGFKRNMMCYSDSQEKIMITMFKAPWTSKPSIQMHHDFIKSHVLDDNLIITKTSVKAIDTSGGQMADVLLAGPIAIMAGAIGNEGAFIDAETGTALYEGKVYKCNKKEILYQLSHIQ